MIKASTDLHDKDTTDPDAWLDMSAMNTYAGVEFLSSFPSFVEAFWASGQVARRSATLLLCFMEAGCRLC